MFSYFLALSLMASAMASEFFSPVPHFGAMLPRDDLIKRQGYYPGTSYCGRGDTCEEACGPTYKQCPSDAGTYCFEPGKNEECCPDGTGNSCDDGYYCTTDGVGTTYCCPDDLDLSNCAASYSLTVSLIRETASVSIPSATSGVAEVTTTSTSSLIHVTPLPTSYPTASVPVLPTANGTYTGPTPPEFTGGAGGRAVGVGMAVLAGAAGVAGLL